MWVLGGRGNMPSQVIGKVHDNGAVLLAGEYMMQDAKL
jgi:hypothetical protein